MMQSFLVVTHKQHVAEELHRRWGDEISLIPLKNVRAVSRSDDDDPMAVVIQLPESARPTEPMLGAPQPDLTDINPDQSRTLEARVDVMERRIIVESLERNHHRRKDTAAELGISRVTLYNKMKKFGLL